MFAFSRRFGLFSALLTAALIPARLLAAPAPAAGASVSMQAPPGSMMMPAIKYVTPRPPQTVAVRMRQGTLTIQDLATYAQYGQIPGLFPLQPEKVAALPGDKLSLVARWAACRAEAAAEAQKSTDKDVIKFTTGYLQPALDNVILANLKKIELEDKVTTPTEQQIAAEYAKHKPEYTVPFSFRMRQLLLTTYESTLVQEGETTLEQVAKRVSGDPALAANIRYDSEQHALRSEEGKTFKPLLAGEKLQVPMNKERQEEVRERLAADLKALKNTEKFEDFARKYSEAGTKGEVSERLPAGTRPLLPEILDAAKKTPVGQISPMFQTKHGWQVIQVVEKSPEHTKTLDEARPEVLTSLMRQQRNQLFIALLNKLFSDPKLEVKYDLIARGDTLSSDTVIATIAGQPVYWNELQKAWQAGGRQNTPIFIKPLLQQLPSFYIPLARLWAERLVAADPNGELARGLNVARKCVIGDSYLRMLAGQSVIKGITPDEVKAYYEKHKDSFKTQPQVRYATMVLNLDDKDMDLKGTERQQALEHLKKNLMVTLNKVHSAEEFMKEANIVNVPLRAKGREVPDGQMLIQASRLEADVAHQLELLSPGKWSGPFISGNHDVQAVLLVERQPAGTMALRDVSPEISKTIYNVRIKEATQKTEEDLLKKAQYTFLLGASSSKPEAGKGKRVAKKGQ